MKARQPGVKRYGRPPLTEASAPQRKMMDLIQTFINRKTFPPTVQELANELRLSTATVHEQLQRLVRMGYLRRERRKARSMEIIGMPRTPSAELVGIPIVGTVPAGTPILAEDNIQGELLVEQSLVRSGSYFALRVKGESMIGAGIRSGDLVVVRQQQVVEQGEIAVARVNDEATVKRLYIHDDHIELRPENPGVRSIRVGPDQDIRIVGKVVAVRRMADK